MRNRIKRVEVLFEFLRVLVAMVIAYALVLVCISFMVEDSVEGIRLFVLGPFESKRRFGNIISRMITLMLTGAGMCFCYASNRFNLAGEGAFMISGCVISLCAISWADAGIPHLLFILILLVIGAACGGPARKGRCKRAGRLDHEQLRLPLSQQLYSENLHAGPLGELSNLPRVSVRHPVFNARCQN